MTAIAARPRSPLLLAGLVVVAVAILCGLGAWQLQRMAEKNAFLERLRGQITVEPAPLPLLPVWDRLDLAALDLTRVRVTGSWLPQASATVRVVMPEAQGANRRPGGFGRYLITAVRLDSGGLVLVNRGFAPEAQFAALPAPTGRADLAGILRRPEAANAFTPPPNPATRDFHLRDPAQIAAALNLAAAPFMVEAEQGTGAATLPVGVDITELIARVPNNHLQYAMTWFGLALTLLGVFAAYWRTLRRRSA